jgi:murein L,D-transpeptidase YcbB/YkuD
MHGRSLIAAGIAGGLTLMPALGVPLAVAAEDVATVAPSVTPTGATPSPMATAPPSSPNAAAPVPADQVPSVTATSAPTVDPVITSIRSKLGDAASPQAADAKDVTALETFYAERNDPPVWITPMGFSARAVEVINEISRADDWGLVASAFDLPPAGALPASVDDEATAEIKLQLAVLKYARFARGGRVDPSRLSPIIDQVPPLLDPKVVLTEIAGSPTPDRYLRSLQPNHEQFQRLRQALLKARNVKPRNEQEIQRILINMERWRWMPAHLGTVYVEDNIPAFMLYVVKNGKTIYSDKIAVGERAYATPVFSANMQSIVFNPEWTVPPTVVREDLLPNLRRGGGWFGGSSILRQHGLQVRYNGRVVDPSSINWTSVNLASISFTQPPGPTNVLGKVKFLYPNTHSVYMHDTIRPNLFNQSIRAIGHNCIRMEKPSKLAEILLAEDKGWDAKKVDDLIAKGYDTAVKIDRPIPVHTTYFTAVVDDTGKITTFADIYGLDRKVAPIVGSKAITSDPNDDAERIASTAPPTKPKARNKNVAGEGLQGLFGD